MRTNRSIGWVTVLALMACVSVGMAAEASVSLDVASAYVFRGATLNDGLVLQPGLEISGLPVTLGVWG
ncbi:MAG: MltA-interacting MipA family protein, partial [Kiritimatiellia bacterium]|nr:MltA-interacting MipA family protein [Kiritimatiellia bacterium]